VAAAVRLLTGTPRFGLNDRFRHFRDVTRTLALRYRSGTALILMPSFGERRHGGSEHGDADRNEAGMRLPRRIDEIGAGELRMALAERQRNDRRRVGGTTRRQRLVDDDDAARRLGCALLASPGAPCLEPYCSCSPSR
jgi:hypothetical protein